MTIRAVPVVLRLLAEFLGTAVLVAAVVGSGLMGQSLTSDLAVILIMNQIATILVLAVLVALLLPVSGAQNKRKRDRTGRRGWRALGRG